MLTFFLSCMQHNTDSAQSTSAPIWTEYNAQESGPFHVGHIQYTHTYTPISQGEPREIVIDIWYPTTNEEGEPAQYLYGSDPLAIEDAEVAPSVYEGGYPIHIHSHGYRGWGATSAFLMRHFASHGWIAIAPNHTNNLLGDHVSPLPISHFIHRPLDLQESLTVLSSLSQFEDLQIHNVLMSGHSFGAGYSAWATAGASYDQVETMCETGAGLEDENMRCTAEEKEMFLSGTLHDSRVQAIVPMAGTVRTSFFGDTGHSGVSIPILFASGTDDGQDAAVEHAQKMAALDFRWLSLEGGCHQAFALGQCELLDTDTGFAILSSYILAFGRAQILHEENPLFDSWLNGTVKPYPEGTLTIPEE